MLFDLELHIFDEPPPSQQPSQSENEDSNSNFLFDDFAEKKDVEQDVNNQENQPQVIDAQTFKENEIRLKAAKSRIDNLEQQVETITDENQRLTKTKMELLDKTSKQMEEMRDEVQNMCNQLQQKEATIQKLMQFSIEGVAPGQITNQHDDEQKINGLGSIGNSIKNGLNYITFGRSKYSTPVHTIGDTKKSKIDLAVSTSQEIERLRSIIRVLSTARTTNGHNNHNNNNTPHRNGLMSIFPGSSPLN